MRFTRVTFGIGASPFLLMATIKKLLKDEGSKTAEEISKNTYMDNLLMMAATTEEALRKCAESKRIFKEAGMNLREYMSSEKSVNDAIPKEDILMKEKIKFLGIRWENDQLIFEFPQRSDEKITKRTVLQTMNSFFDPLGLFTPAMLQAKIFFQSTWEIDANWDSDLPEEMCETWNGVLESWKVPPIVFPRLILPNDQTQLTHQLHVFTDASEKAYATAVYLITSNGMGISSKLLLSKNRLAKKKETTIPRLELVAILIGLRAVKFVKKELQLESSMDQQIYLWSDSQIALHWIASRENQPVFISNRLREIRAHKDVLFNYVQTSDNPADYATRGMAPEELRNKKMWWDGPDFLIKSKCEWPSILTVKPPEDEEETNVEEPNDTTADVKVAILMTTPKEIIVPKIFDSTRYSSYGKLIKMTTIFLKFLKFIITKGKGENLLINKMSSERRITARDLKIGELYLIRSSQRLYPVNEHEKRRWNLHMDSSQILRCQTRLQKSKLAADSINPIFLPKKAPITSLIITQIHEEQFHAGVQLTFSKLRKKYWTPNGRRTINKSIKRCINCRKIKGPAYKMPPFPPYPEVRVVSSPAFTHVGLDYLGPTKISINGSHESYWILLITCLSTRAVHLEGIPNMTTSTFLNAFRRFCAIRKTPSTILSDNATQFIAASKALNEVWQNAITSEEATSYYAKKQIEWKTTIPQAPWEGAVYERLVGLVKTAFKGAIGRRILPIDEMQTLIAEVSSTLNSRPITPMDDQPDTIVALRPIDFIQPLADAGCPPITEDHDDEEWLPRKTTANELLKKWKDGNRALNKFWSLWQKLYLDTLKDRQQRLHKQPHHKSQTTPRLGEIVLIMEEALPRGFWKMGRIVELPDEDPTKVRSAKVIMPNGHILKRSLRHLVPLEISEEKPNEEHPKDDQPEVPKPEDQKDCRITRSMKAKQTVAAVITKAPALKPVPFFVLVITLISLIGQSVTMARECPTNYTLSNPIRIHSEVCKRNGTAIWRLDDHEVCSTEIFCPAYQHLSPAKNEEHPLKGIDNELPQFYLMVNYCGPKCFCPNWSDGCSFYNGPSAHISDVKNEATKMALDEFKEEICSFQMAENCSKTPLKKHIHKVELYDGTHHFVTKLDLKSVEVIEYEFECVGGGSTITGSKKYCEKHQCSNIGQQYCYYPKSEATMLNLGNVSFPIKSWSTYEAQIYHYPVKHEAKTRPKTCTYCKLECVEGGIRVTTNEEVGLMELCAHHFCVNREFPSATETIQLPDEVLLADHKVKVKLWSMTKEEIRISNDTIQCKKLSVCELIRCSFCLNHLKNPECIPKWVILLAAIILYITVSKLVACLQLLQIFSMSARWLCRLSWILVRFCGRGGCRCCRRLNEKLGRMAQKQVQTQPEDPVNSPRASRFEPIYFTAVILVTLAMSSTINACSEVAIMEAKQSTCKTIEEGLTQCTITDNALISLAPIGQESCLLLRNKNGAMGQLTIEANKVEISCQPVKMYHTRSYEMKPAVSKRCPKMGSCSGDFCANVKTNTKIEELGSANNAPGHSYCQESCSWCDDCLLPTAACLFFRIYTAPLPEDPLTYTVFKCPNWQYKIKAMVTHTNAKGLQISKYDTTLAVGRVTKMGPFQLTITSIETAPMPILGEMFISNEKKTAIIIDGTRSNLFMRCPSATNATNFQCEVMPDRCQCVPAMATLNCECVQMNLAKEVMTKEHVLPIDSAGFVLKGQGMNVYTEIPFSPMQAQITVEDLELTAVYSETLCRVTTATIEGCSACLHGATFKARCETDQEDTALAHVTCGPSSFLLHCGGKTEITKQIQFSDNTINFNCSVDCPKGTTFFNLIGHLSSLDSSINQIFTNSKITPQSYYTSTINFSLFFEIVKQWKLWFALCFIIIYIAPKILKLLLRIMARLLL